MNIGQSQLAALEAARSALAERQYDLTKEVKDLLESADGYAKDEVPDWLNENLQTKKVRLADTMLAREALFDLQYKIQRGETK